MVAPTTFAINFMHKIKYFTKDKIKGVNVILHKKQGDEDV